jgi:hypothetical protein
MLRVVIGLKLQPKHQTPNTMPLVDEKNRLDSEIKRLRSTIPLIVDKLRLTETENFASWNHIIDTKLLPRLAPDFPLVVSICGGGSSGKSTLFNSIIQKNISPTGGTAGINRRILISANSERFDKKESFPELFEPFGYRPVPLMDKHELITPGESRYILNPQTPSNLILLDTPDFDTGAKGIYTNRDMARQALEASDLFIYIFTNANYNNRDNTDFISKMLTHIGKRKCFLIYRVYAGYIEDEIRNHARTVAENIYGDQADRFVLGVYRADEDNRVATDEKLMEIRPLKNDGLSLMDVLNRLDIDQLRIDLLSSILNDVLHQADLMVKTASTSRNELRLYRDALQTWQSHCVHEALQHFPMDVMLQRFTEIWLKTDPAHIRWMRKAGDIIELPLKAVSGTIQWMRGKPGKKRDADASIQHFSEQLEEDLVSAVNSLWRKAVNPEISVSLIKKDPVAKEMVRTYQSIEATYQEKSLPNPHRAEASEDEEITFSIQAHPALQNERKRIRSGNWQDVLSAIMDRKNQIIHVSERIDGELAIIVDQFRSRMNFLSSIRQTFSALLNVLPATVAVSYILTTGDPVGAAGIKVKLTGLFGLKDLYALVAIPATTGLKKADQKQLEDMIGPIAKSWLEHKLNAIQQLFEEEISGGLLQGSEETLETSGGLLSQAKVCIANCRKLTGRHDDGA